MKKIIILTILILLMSCHFAFGTFDDTKPADSDAWNNAAGFIRINNAAMEVEFGIDLGAVGPYYQATAPTLKPDAVTALEASDNGRLWVDSDDTKVYVLTNFAIPTWTAQGAGELIQTADATFTLQNTDQEDSDGGRQSRFISKGEQSGGEATTLGYMQFSHDGTGDDEKGKWGLFLNAGSDANAPSNQAIGFTADGKVDVSNSLAVLDEDDLSSDGDKVLATQQSIKAYADAAPAAQMTPATYAGGESVTLPNGLIMKMGVTSSISGDATTELTYGAAFPTAIISMQVSPKQKNLNHDGTMQIQQKSGSLLTVAEITNSQNAVSAPAWWIVIGY